MRRSSVLTFTLTIERVALAASRRAACHAAQRSADTRSGASCGIASRAARSPSSIVVHDSAKLAALKLPSAGWMSTSPGRSWPSDTFTFWSVRMLIIWPATPNSELTSSREARLVPRFTAMRRVAPMSRATSMPRLRTSPPSTYSRPSISCGANTPGTDMLARTAALRMPSSSTFIRPDSMSVAIARNGIANSSNDSRVTGGPRSDCRNPSSC